MVRKDHLRKHVMHTAVLLGLVGFIGGAVMATKDQKLGDLLSTGQVIRDGKDRTVSTVEQVVMSLLCGVFTGLCGKSFIDARRARKANAPSTSSR